MIQRAGPSETPVGPRSAGQTGPSQPRFDRENASKWHGSRLVHRFPLEKARREASGGSSENPDLEKRSRQNEKTLGDLCTRRSLCRFGATSVSNRNRHRVANLLQTGRWDANEREGAWALRCANELRAKKHPTRMSRRVRNPTIPGHLRAPRSHPQHAGRRTPRIGPTA